MTKRMNNDDNSRAVARVVALMKTLTAASATVRHLYKTMFGDVVVLLSEKNDDKPQVLRAQRPATKNRK